MLKKPDVKKCTFSEYRNWVMINYVLGTGQRLNTIRNIKICDIDLNNEEVVVTTMKNKKQKTLPLPHTLVLILKEYLRYRGGEPDGYLFCTQYGKQLTSSGLQSAIQNYNKKRRSYEDIYTLIQKQLC